MPPPEIISWLEVAGNAAKVIAILVGGFWSVLLAIWLQQWKRGRIELANIKWESIKLERESKKFEQETVKLKQETVKLEQESKKLEIDIKKVELEIIRQAVLHLSIQTSQEKSAVDNARYILANVEIENKGNRNTVIAFEQKQPLAVRSVQINDSGQTLYGEARRFPVSMGRNDEVQGGWVIRTGSKQQLPFCVRLDEPGLYQISFHATLDAAEKDISSGLGKQTNDWWVMTYVMIV